MKNILEMRAKRATLLTEARGLHDKAVAESRDMSADENVQYDKIMADIDGLKVKIDREERHIELSKEMEAREGQQAGMGAGGAAGQPDRKAEYRAAFTKFLVGGIDSLAAEERSLVLENRALSTTGGSGSQGGYTIPEGFYNDLVLAMKDFGGMRSVARILPTATGNNLPIPTANNTAQVGRILAENTAATTQDPSFGSTNLGAYKYTSDIVLIPLELLQDSAFNLEAYLRNELATRIARITNQHFTTGTGTGQPTGIVTGATAGKVGATGQTTSIVVDDLVDMEHSIDPAYRGRARWMLHDNSLKALKKLKDAEGRQLWSPGLAVGSPDTILGYGYTINQDMAVMAASAKSILFGDLASYWIRDVMDVQMVRFGEKYMDAAQIGFVAFSRHDGKFINAGGNQITYYQNSAT